MNNCSFIGNMGKDPRFFAASGSKKAFITFSLAIQNPFQKGEDGKSKTDWLDFTAFGKTAELINQYVPTGRKLGVNARAAKDSYVDKEGKTIYTIKFNVNDITFCENAGGSNAGGNTNNAPADNSGINFGTPANNNLSSVDTDDLPF